METGATVTATFLRGKEIYRDGTVLGQPTGQYLHRRTVRPDRASR